MKLLINAGGSLSVSLLLLGGALGWRLWRGSQRRSGPQAVAQLRQPRCLCTLTVDALTLLVSLDALPHHIVDVREAHEAAGAPLPAWLLGAAHVPEPQLGPALCPPHTGWPGAAGAADEPDEPGSLPSPRHLLVLLASSPEQEALAVAHAAAAGCDKVAVLAPGALAQLLRGRASREMPAPQPLQRDALAVLLGLAPLPEAVFRIFGAPHSRSSRRGAQQQAHAQGRASPLGARSSSSSNLPAAGGASPQQGGALQAQPEQQQAQRLVVLDVRRHDERALYGGLPGAQHVPADELASALALPAAAFRRRYHFEPPRPGLDVVVTHSRATRRALWAAQLARDAGFKQVLVYQQGVLGWRFSLVVQAYPPYQPWQAPPEPEQLPAAASPDSPDVAAGVAELQALGLMEAVVAAHALGAGAS